MTKVEQVAAKGDVLEPLDEDHVYVLVTFKVTAFNNINGELSAFFGGWMGRELIDDEGGTAYQYNNGCLRPSSLDFFQPMCRFSESVTFRKAYVVKRGVRQACVKLKTDTSREIRGILQG